MKNTITIEITLFSSYHIRRLKVRVFIECGPTKTALEQFDEVEDKTRPNLHQRCIFFNDLWDTKAAVKKKVTGSKGYFS